MDYRSVQDGGLQEFEGIAHYAFSPEDERGEHDRADDPSSQFGDPRALFEGGEMTAVCRLLELEARCRDDWITLGGLRGVATPPEHRRESRAVTLIEESLSEFTERGVPLVALWPFDHDFYADMGWATAAKHLTYRLSPATLAPVAEKETGRLFRPSADEWERLQNVNLVDGEGTSLSLRRTEDWWRYRVFERSGTKRHVYAWERDGGLESYVVFTVEKEGDDRVLRVEDVAAVDDRAFRHVCWVLFNHDSQVETIEITERSSGPPGELLDRIRSPESATCELEHGAMIRIADVPTALEALSYPDELSATLGLDVDDELAEWNDGTFAVSFEDGRARCRADRTEDQTPDVTIDVGTLSQLVVGYCDVEQATTIGTLKVDAEETRAVLEDAFPPRPVELSEFF